MKSEVVDGNIERCLGQRDKPGDAVSDGIGLRDALGNFGKGVVALLLKKHDLDDSIGYSHDTSVAQFSVTRSWTAAQAALVRIAGQSEAVPARRLRRHRRRKTTQDPPCPLCLLG